MRVRFIIICLVGCVLVQCTSPRPKYYSISEPDYNSRVKVTKPRYKQKLNAGGFIFKMGLAGAGGYLGYNSDIIQYNNRNNEVQSSNIAGLVTGVIVGYGIGSLINYIIFDQGQTFRINQKKGGREKWVRRYDKDYQLVPTNGYGMMMIRMDAERNYIVKNYQDFIHFTKTFPNSDYYENVINQYIPVARRNDLVKIIEFYPQTKHREKILYEYIDRSTSLSDLLYGLDSYPGVYTKEEKKASSLVTNYHEFKLYHDRFGYNEYTENLIRDILNKTSHSNLGNLIDLLPNSIHIDEIKYKFMVSSPSLAVLLKNNELYPHILSKRELQENALDLVHDFYTAKQFYSRFRDSDFVEEIESLSTPFISRLFKVGKSGNSNKVFLINKDNNFYAEGGWSDGLPSGNYYIKSSNYEYDGNIKNGMKHGYGEFKSLDFEFSYKGNYYQNKRQGKGEMIDGNYKYVGEFRNNWLNGKGKKWKDKDNEGQWIKGDFINGYCHGECEVRFDGFRIKGEYNKGTPIGEHSVKKWILIEGLNTYEGTLVFDDKGNMLSSTEDFNAFAPDISGNSTEIKSVACAEYRGSGTTNICGSDVETQSYRCKKDGTFEEMYYWTKSLEDKCNKNAFYWGTFEGNGFYQPTLGHDRYLGNDKEKAIKKLCYCNK